MLKITVPGKEMYNEETNEFFTAEPYTLQLEHSLVSLSKWESKWNKPFLGKDTKTIPETMDYIRCMTITQNVPDDIYDRLSEKNIEDIKKYIDAPMTATTFSNFQEKKSNETITSELIYYWMIALTIPMECQKWHLNRLLTLIRVCNIKNTPPKKMSKSEIMRRNASLNAARRKAMNSKG